jgi:hypothetical protein
MSNSKHEDLGRLERAIARYRNRFLAAHPEWEHGAPMRMSIQDDHRLFGDLVDPRSLNKVNTHTVEQYMDVIDTRILEMAKSLEAQGIELEDEDLSGHFDQLLAPVMCGMFEHVFLLGYFYRDEVSKDRNAKIGGVLEELAERADGEIDSAVLAEEGVLRQVVGDVRLDGFVGRLRRWWWKVSA